MTDDVEAPAPAPRPRHSPRLLGVLLCYNDADFLEDAIDHLIANRHDIVVWDHGSTDDTPRVLDAHRGVFVERRHIPRDFDFYELYPTMSRHLMEEYAHRYDWISWPDQDELLEGPRRDRPYHEYLAELIESPHDWVEFRNFNFWVTEEDDPAVHSPVARVRHYALFDGCSPRVRSWRASVTNVREFNHNPLPGAKCPVSFNLRHYPARTYEQLERRVFVDRAGMSRSGMNYHYDAMRANLDRIRVPADRLHLDDGVSELIADDIFDWWTIYRPPDRPEESGHVSQAEER